MLTDYMEGFVALSPVAEPDGLGGENRTWTEGTAFSGALIHAPGVITPVGGRPTPVLTPLLLHEAAAALVPGQQLRRVRDGSLWRVTSASEDMSAPAWASLPVAAVTLERLVIP